MLDLQQTYANVSGKLHTLSLPTETLTLYASADAVIIHNSISLGLVRVLAFSEAHPASSYESGVISCLTTDSGMKLVFAALSNKIAAWTMSDRPVKNTWRVHSSLQLPENQTVTSMSVLSGVLAVTTNETLSAYTLALENDLPTWSPKWSIPTGATSHAQISPSLVYIATSVTGDSSVRIYLTSSGRPLQNIRHPRAIHDLAWRSCDASHRDDMALFTVTTDATLRIYLPVIDDPERLQLHASLDIFGSLPYPALAAMVPRTELSSPTSSILWLDHAATHAIVKDLIANSASHEDAHVRRLQDIKDGDWDMFLRILMDGSVVVSAVANVDRRPPTLLRQFTVVHVRSPLPVPSSGLVAVPLAANIAPGRKGAFLITSSNPLGAYLVDLAALLDAKNDAITLLKGLNPSPSSLLSPIQRLGRTPDGRGLAVLRSSGFDTWTVNRRGSSLECRQQHALGQDVVVLDEGRLVVAYANEQLTMFDAQGAQAFLKVPPFTTIFSLHHHNVPTSLIGLTEDFEVVHVLISISGSLSLRLNSNGSLPLRSAPDHILPVDPMAWSELPISTISVQNPALLLSITKGGELAFWTLQQDQSEDSLNWTQTGKVSTGRKGIRTARCSSAKKTVLVAPNTKGDVEELTIWDSKESEFASGLEYRAFLNAEDLINDLDWSSTPDNQSILAIGFATRVELLCEKRMTYFDEQPAWTTCWRIDMSSTIPYPISDSIWLTNGSLAVATGHIISLYTQSHRSSSPASKESLFEHVARFNGPLEDYHPQMLLQLLLWGKFTLVRDIIVALAKAVELRIEGDEFEELEFQRFDMERYLQDEEFGLSVQPQAQPSKPSAFRKALMFDDGDDIETSNDRFSPHLVDRLLKKLEARPLPHMTSVEHAHLLVLLQTTLEVDEQRRAIDANGLRYLTSMRSFYILNSLPESSSAQFKRPNSNIPAIGRRERLRYRDMIWAFHSETQEILLQASVAACDGKMSLFDTKALGVFLWLNSLDSLKAHVEMVARNQYMAGDTRDPTACSLLYFALGKHKLVHGLWRQAAWHKEQTAMLKFLTNDFSQDRWKTAALKNAFALMSKQRFEYAAAFFLLGGSLKDAVNVCIRNLADFQLAIAIARVVEGSNNGPVLMSLLSKTVIPKAFQEGNRWLASWGFWLMHRRDLAVRILVMPLSEVALSLDPRPSEIGDPHYDDPSLALLFSQLKMKTLQTAKGTSEISGKTETSFVLQTARVFVKMGCHSLALNLIRKWSFERPMVSQPTARSDSPVRRRSEMATLMQRQPSMFIDMDVPSATPTRPASPIADTPSQKANSNGPEAPVVKTGLGNLIKAAKHDVAVPEFDMDSFGF